MAESRTVPPGTRYDARRQWLLPQGVVARDLPRHPLFPRPKKNASGRSYAVSFDELAGNTMLGMHMSRLQPGANNRGHRHLDEALIYIVSGRGWSELRQGEDAPLQRIDWEAGDLLAIPANAWHQHFNADQDSPSRNLAFKNTQFLRKSFQSRALVYDSSFRFHDRYDDEPDYWKRREIVDDGVVETNVIRDLAAQSLAEAEGLGRSLTAQHYRMGGHEMLEVTLLELGHRGHVARHRHVVEEGVYVLSGRGRTIISSDDGREVTFRWRPGDLFSPPLGCWHQHISEAREPTRLLIVRNRAVERAIGAPHGVLRTVVPDRFPTLVEPDYRDDA